MTRNPVWIILWRCVQVPLLFLAAPMIAVLAACQIQLLPTFLSPEYATFWQDVIDYHSRADGHKSLDQLYNDYDKHIIHDHVVNPNFTPALIPSDKAMLAYGLNSSIDDQKGTQLLGLDWVIRSGITILAFYALVAFFVNSVGRAFAWSICHTYRAVRLYRDYYDVPWHRRLLGGLITLPFVVALAAFSASLAWTPAMGNVGISYFHLVFLFVLLSYVSGLGLRLIRSLLCGVFIAFGIDPEKTFWDEVLTLLVTVPLLLFIYKNSWISVSADAVAGLGPLVVTKLLQRFWPTLPGLAPVTPNEPPSRLSSLWLGISLAVLGILMAGLCGCMLVAVPGMGDTTVVTVADVEQPSWKHMGGTTVRVTDGYLFWPKLVAHEPSIPTKDRYVSSYYVPLVSREVLDEWLEEYRQKGERAEYSFEKARVIAEFEPEDFARLFPGIEPGKFDPEEPFTAYAAEGRVSTSQPVSDALSARTRGFRKANLVVVTDGSQSVTRQGSVATVVIGLVCILPMMIWLAGFLITLLFQKAPWPTPLTTTPYDYHWRDRGRTAGPVSFERLQDLARQGVIRRRDPVWVESRRRWVRAHEVPELFPPQRRPRRRGEM